MGFDEKRFSGDVDEDFRCSICQDIIEDPIATQCEHVFCKICINEWLQTRSSCPVDRKPLSVSQLCQPSRFFRNPYSRLLLKCQFESNGCQISVKIEDLKSHQNKCKFNPNVKHECENGCEALLTQNESISHNCIQYLKSINLQLKEELDKANKRDSEHEKLVRDLQSLVSTQRDQINELKQKVENQSKPESETVVIPRISQNLFSSIRVTPPSRPSLHSSPLFPPPALCGGPPPLPSSIRSSTSTQIMASPEQRKLVESLKTKGSIKTLIVERTLLSVDRKLFCSSDPYNDGPKGIGFGTTISAPHMHAYILELLKDHLKNGSSVLDIGSGSGYLTICMAEIVGSSGRVIGVDHVKQLIDRSKGVLNTNFSNLRVDFVVSDGRNGYPSGAPYDVINIGGAVTEVPQTILDQLRIGGRLIAPIGSSTSQQLVTIDKQHNGSFKRQSHLSVMFGSIKDLETQLRS